MVASMRSELVRLRRKGLLLAWFGLMAGFAVMVNTIMFGTAADGTPLPEGAPGVAFPTAAALASADGLMAGLPAAASMFGVVTLSFWAVAVATDYSTGLVRLLVAARPQRWPLLVGKVTALAVFTAIATTVATVVNLAVAPAAAQAAGIGTATWTDGALGTVASTWASTFTALLVWGIVGLAIAYVTRSAAIAISAGVAYVLVVEPMIARMIDGDAPWLLGSTLTALAAGGDAATPLGSALASGTMYAAVGLTAAVIVLLRRDVTD